MSSHCPPFYACTYSPSKCHELYTRVSEWEAHEFLHPPHADVWFCGEGTQDGGMCPSAFELEDDLIIHLRSSHGLELYCNEDGDFEIENLRIGPSHGKYWCGFCRGVVGVAVPGGDLGFQNDRFRHMMDHFTRGWFIEEWLAILIYDEDNDQYD